MSGRTAIVVGAGWAGLAAAHHLTSAGVAVLVVDENRYVGGRAFSFTDPGSGLRLDNGQHVLLGVCAAFRSLLAASGLDEAVRFQPRLEMPVQASARAATLRAGALPGPLAVAMAVAGYPMLSWRERRSALAAGVRILRTTRSDRAGDETFAAWLARSGQSGEAVRYLWDLIGTAVLNASAHEVSAALALRTFRLLLTAGPAGSGLGTFTRPLGDVAEAFRHHLTARGVRFAQGVRVEQVVVDGARVVGVRGRDGQLLDAAMVILALPPDRLARLAYASGLEHRLTVPALAWSPILNVFLLYQDDVWDGEVAALPDEWGCVVFNRHRLMGSSAGHVLAVSVSAANGLRRERPGEVAAEVERRVCGRLGIAPAARAVPVWQTRATFLGTPGVEALRPGAVTSVLGLYLAGAWTATGWPDCLEGAVRSGALAAQACAADPVLHVA